MQFKLKTKLRDYYKLQKKVQALDLLGKECNNQELFELEEEIEKYFHLPNGYTPFRDEIQLASFEFENELSFVKHVSKELISITEDFFKSNALTDTEILKRALNDLDAASNVFPLINCPMTSYSMFIYYKMFLRKKLSIAEFISIIPKLNKLSISENFLIANMNQHPSWDLEFELLKLDLPHLKKFIDYTYTSKVTLGSITQKNKTDEEFISTFEIWDIRFFKDDNEIIIIPIIDFSKKNKFVSARLKLNEFDFKKCLLNSTNFSFFESLIPMLELFKKEKLSEVSYQLCSVYKSNIIIVNYPICDYAIID